MRFYRIGPADREPTHARVEKVIAAWDEQDVAIGVAPELCLSRALLERWQERSGSARARGSAGFAWCWRAAATWTSSPPSNEAVLLDARTGEVLVRQRRVHPFNFSQQDLELWGLSERLTAPVDEDLSRGEKVCVVEAGGARLDGVRGPGSVTRVRRRPSRPWGVAAPGAGVRSADEGPAGSARARSTATPSAPTSWSPTAS